MFLQNYSGLVNRSFVFPRIDSNLSCLHRLNPVFLGAIETLLGVVECVEIDATALPKNEHKN